MRTKSILLTLSAIWLVQFTGCQDFGETPTQIKPIPFVIEHWRGIGGWGGVPDTEVQLVITRRDSVISGNGKVTFGLYWPPKFEITVVEIQSYVRLDGRTSIGLIFDIPSRGQALVGRFVSAQRFEGQYTFDDDRGFSIAITKQDTAR